MKQILVLAVIISVATLFTLSTRDASAERVLTNKQIDSIVSSCQDIKTNLGLLDASDALLRTNIGQRYENIMTSLMSPLNSRLLLNQVNNIALATTAVEYSKALDKFRDSYFVYENSLVNVIDIDCESSPVEFYTAIEETRKERKVLQQSVKTLNRLLVRFQKEFKIIKVDWTKANE